jgi:hypothetical protein
MHALVSGHLSARLFSEARRCARLVVMGATMATLVATSCKDRVSKAQCDDLLGRFAQLVVKEKLPSAPADVTRAEQAREREEAARDDNFKNCTTELRIEEYRCAMAATTADALLRCLE